MNCPFCPFEAPPRALHAHLGEAHPDAVTFEERGDRSFYALTCPICGDSYEHQIKPRGRDRGFVEEFSAQIRLVAFDMLVNHLLGEHEGIDAGRGAGEGDAAAAGPEAAPAAPGPGPAWLIEARKAAGQGEPDSTGREVGQ